MKRLVLLLALAALPACNSNSSGSGADASPSPSPQVFNVIALSRPVKAELNGKLEKAPKVFHIGCKDEEKASCKDASRVCGPQVEKEIKATLGAKKKAASVVIEWEAPRETWQKNEGVLDHYWLVNPDGSGTYFYLLPSPDDVETNCGGEYCGWHKDEAPAGTFFKDGKLHLTPHKGKEITDLQFCPP